ncbi:g8745 [Coccomyxa viridis]|uniref:G8745 protein n=1 Tax=Coccomyxa viridis TaxID=1274662 RepID=A0ABP1G3S5_9CHLO
MGYTGLYSLGARCGSEAIATGLMIFLGEGTLANELLNKTKGHNMGFGWVAFGFGYAFFVALICLSHISAHMNPAYCLGLWLIGDLDAADFFALSAAELGGAMIGAVLVWLFYLPHFKSLPEPPALSTDDVLLRSRDAVAQGILDVASYDTRPHASARKGFKDAFKDVRYYLAQPNHVHEHYHVSLVEHALGKESVRSPEGYLRRHSVQVCDMHARLKKLESDNNMDWDTQRSTLGRAASLGSFHRHQTNVFATQSTPPVHGQHQDLQKAQIQGGQPDQKPKTHLDALYEAAIVADQNAKLSVFSTRPGIRSPLFNWLVEFLATLTLVMGVLLIDARGVGFDPQLAQLWNSLKAFFVGLFVVVLILGLGGPTGIAMNPARDFGPRLVHWALPIPGKGSSEWDYSWIPVTGGFVGGLAGAALFKGINEISLHTLA